MDNKKSLLPNVHSYSGLKILCSTEAQLFLQELKQLHVEAASQLGKSKNIKHVDLYKFLGKTYALTQRLNACTSVNAILAVVISYLKDNHRIRLSKKSTVIDVVVRFVVREDRLNSFRYRKVLELAKKENIDSNCFVEFVVNHGGILNICNTFQSERKSNV